MKKKEYMRPEITAIAVEQTLLDFNSGLNVDSNHEGDVEEDGDLVWGDND